MCWGLEGNSIRQQRFVVIVALTSAVLPLMKVLAAVFGRGESISTDPQAGFSIVFAIVILIVPLVAYIYSAPEHSSPLMSKTQTFAYVRGLGWAPS